MSGCRLVSRTIDHQAASIAEDLKVGLIFVLVFASSVDGSIFSSILLLVSLFVAVVVVVVVTTNQGRVDVDLFQEQSTTSHIYFRRFECWLAPVLS